MAEQLLNRAQVGAALEEVRRERVAKAMRMADEPPHSAGVEPPAPCGKKQRVDCAAHELGPTAAQVAGEVMGGLLPERDDPLLATLSPDVHRLALEVDVGEVEPDGLGAAKPAGVEELEERAIA